MTDSPGEVPQSPAVPPSTKSAFDRMAGVLFAPAETFEDIVRRPNILAPLLLILISALISAIIFVPKLDFESMMREQMAQQGRQMSEADMDRVIRFGGAFSKAMGYATPVFSIITLAIIAGVLLLAFRLMGGEGTYKEAFSVTLHAWMPFVIVGVIATIIMFTRQTIAPDMIPTLVRSNLGFLADPREQRILFTLLSAIDIFTAWSLALFSIGFSYVGRVSRARSAAIVITLWAVVLVFKLGFAYIGSMQSGAA